MKKILDLSPIPTWDEKVSGEVKEWAGDVIQIKYSLRSEKKKKYFDKFLLLNKKLRNFRDALMITLNDDLKKAIPRLTSRESAEAEFGTDNWRVEVWDCFYQYASPGGIKETLDRLEKEFKIVKKKETKTKISELKNQKKELNSTIEQLVLRNFPDYFEYKILQKICTCLAPFRQNLLHLLEAYFAHRIDDTMWVMEKTRYADAIADVKELFTKTYQGLNEYMKMQYLFWLMDLGKIDESLVARIKVLREEYEDRLLVIGGKKPAPSASTAARLTKTKIKSVFETYTDRIGVFSDQFEEIDDLWRTISDSDVEPLAEQMNAKKLFVNKSKKNEFAKSEKVGIYWWWAKKDLTEEGVSSGGKSLLYPYMEYTKRIKISDQYLENHISLKTSLLFHEINDDLPAGKPTEDTFYYDKLNFDGETTETLYAYEALFAISFTNYSNTATDKQTMASYFNSFRSDLDDRLVEIEMEVEGTPEIDSTTGEPVKDPKTGEIIYAIDPKNPEERLIGLAKKVDQTDKYFPISKGAKAQLEKAEMLERTDWTRKYSNTKQIEAISKLDRLKGELKAILKKIEDRQIFGESYQELTITSTPAKFDGSEIGFTYKLLETFNNISPTNPTKKQYEDLKDLMENAILINIIQKKRQSAQPMYNAVKQQLNEPFSEAEKATYYMNTRKAFVAFAHELTQLEIKQKRRQAEAPKEKEAGEKPEKQPAKKAAKKASKKAAKKAEKPAKQEEKPAESAEAPKEKEAREKPEKQPAKKAAKKAEKPAKQEEKPAKKQPESVEEQIEEFKEVSEEDLEKQLEAVGKEEAEKAEASKKE